VLQSPECIKMHHFELWRRKDRCIQVQLIAQSNYLKYTLLHHTSAYSCVFVFSLVAVFHLYSLFRSRNFHPCSLVPFFMSRIFSVPAIGQGQCVCYTSTLCLKNIHRFVIEITQSKIGQFQWFLVHNIIRILECRYFTFLLLPVCTQDQGQTPFLFTSAYCLQLLFYVMVFSNKDSILIEQLIDEVRKLKTFWFLRSWWCCVPKIIGIGRFLTESFHQQ